MAATTVNSPEFHHSSRTYHHRASVFFAPPSSPAATTVNSPEFHHKSRAPFPRPLAQNATIFLHSRLRLLCSSVKLPRAPPHTAPSSRLRAAVTNHPLHSRNLLQHLHTAAVAAAPTVTSNASATTAAAPPRRATTPENGSCHHHVFSHQRRNKP